MSRLHKKCLAASSCPHGLLVLVFSATALAGIEDLGPATCGSLNNAYGPFDYRTATEEQHRMVEGAHFLGYIESLKRGKNAVTPGPDIDYTLRVFPNHHRALLLQQGILDQHTAPLGEEAQGVVKLGNFVGWRRGQLLLKLLADVSVKTHIGKWAWASARMSASLRVDLLATTQRSKKGARPRHRLAVF